jgi:uridylate kinase
MVVLRLSGGAFRNGSEVFDTDRLERITDELVRVAGRTQLVVVIGGGNIARGRDLSERFGLPSEITDNIGMLATIANACMLGALLNRREVPNMVLSTHNLGSLISGGGCLPSFENILECLSQGQIVIVGGGTGKGGVTTDTAAVRLAKGLQASIILKGTNVNGIYSADPYVDLDAKLISNLSCRDFLDRGLSQIFDPKGVEETTIPIGVFNILTPGLLLEAIAGRFRGSMLIPKH